MSIDLSFDDGQSAIADALGQFCRDRCDEGVVKATAGHFPVELWGELAALGVLAIATPEGEGGALELVAAMEALGGAVFPGPLAATVLATQLLAEKERRAVAEGRSIVSVGVPPLMPWAQHADVFLALDGAQVWRARPSGEIEPVETLGGEPWGRVELERLELLAGSARAHALADTAAAAYLAAAGAQLVSAASAHARTRTQFGRPIGEFQAVAHPLADCWIRLSAAETLARAAAFQFDRSERSDWSDLSDAEGDDAEARGLAAAARLSANAAALEAAYVCHQVFGAVGIALEGPVFHVSRRIRQLASLPPGEGPGRSVLLARIGLGVAA